MKESRYRLSNKVKPQPNLRGEGNGKSKLTDAEVKVIIARYNKGGVTQAYLAKHFNISQQAISRIIRNQAWKR